MNVAEALLLGVVQGLTEFLPISSTAHLRIVPALAGRPDPGAAFTAVLQLGTLFAVVSYFVRDLLGMARAAAAPGPATDPRARRLFHILAGTLPIVIAGLAFRPHIESSLRALPVIGVALIVVGLAMAAAERYARHERDLDAAGLRDALLVGAAQALALIPGVSRSGITLCAALALGLRRDDAARFSFLLSVPAIGAAGVLELPLVLGDDGVGAPALVAGLGAAAISGYACIAWLLRFLRTHTMLPFVVYRVALGAAILIAAAAGVLR